MNTGKRSLLALVSTEELIDDEFEDESDKDAAYLIQKTKFCRLPANDVGMGLPVYASQLHETNINSKTSHNKKHVPFVEVNLSNGRTVYLRKTTLVWML